MEENILRFIIASSPELSLWRFMSEMVFEKNFSSHSWVA